MLTEAFQKLQENKFVKALNAFFRSGTYAAVVAALMACSELFSLELPVFYCYVVLAVICVLFGEDTLGTVPLVCCSFMTISARNNPRYCENTVFGSPAFMTQTIVLAAVALVLFAVRLVCYLVRRRGQNDKKLPRLTFGFAVLGIFYIIGGAFSPYFSGGSAFYGFVQIVSLCLFYFFFYYSVDWSKAGKDYALKLFLIIGAGLAAQIAGMYCNVGVFEEGGVNRNNLFVGWGTYNNIGCAMTICMPAAFYFALTRKHGWAYTVLGTLYFLAVWFTQSRGSILFGTVVYFICAVVVTVKADLRARILHLVVFGVFAVALFIYLLAFHERASVLFKSLLDAKLNSSGRLKLFKESWEAFLAYPFLGVGWGGRNPNAFADNAFYPFWSHNTFLQLLMTGGVLLFLAYAFHRVQTGILLFRRPSAEKTFAGLCILSLLLTGMLDCHIFTIGPGFFYAVFLVFAERTEPPAVRLSESEK